MTRRATLDVQTIAHTTLCPPTGDDGSLIFTPEGNTGEDLAVFAGRSCYQAWERKRPETATNKGYLANIQKQSHWSVLEHASVTFYVQGVSRALTHELVRHRHMSYSQLSQRYVDSKDVKFVVPPLIEDMIMELAQRQSQGSGTVTRGERTYTVAEYAAVVLDDCVERVYADEVHVYEEIESMLRWTFPDLGTKKYREAARSVLPNATETKIVVTGNYRSWAEFLTKRDSLAADAEFQRLAKEIGRQLSEIAPNVFGDEARALWDHAFAEQGASSI